MTGKKDKDPKRSEAAKKGHETRKANRAKRNELLKDLPPHLRQEKKEK